MIIGVSLQSKTCTKCEEVKKLDEFTRNRAHKDGYRSECKACNNERAAKYYAANLEKIKEYKAANSEKIKDSSAEYRAANPEKIKLQKAKYRAANPEKIKERDAKYRAANPEKGRAYCAKRRAAKLLAIPSWLTKEDYQAMEAIYKEADRLTQKTGIKMHVDHIHPLQGELVRGFYCPSNLQILTEAENCSKGNKFTPYVESELLV